MNVLLIVIDAATPRVVGPAIRMGRLPTMQRLAAAGSGFRSSTTIFPSITPAATTSIITGTYPVHHGIAGASWFDEIQEQVAYYGDDFWVIAREGFGTFLQDFLLRLNGDRLKVPTLFQMVERAGKTAACLNYLVFKGDTTHEARVPTLLSLLPGVSSREAVHGPSQLWLGDFVSGPRVQGRTLHHKGGLLHRFGMDDRSTGTLLCELAESGLPDLTVAYFADNDYRSHEVGPHGALPVLEQVDAMLAEAFEAGGGFEVFLRETCVIVTSDHGHCEVLADADRALIRLDERLSDFRQATLGGLWREDDELMICPNMRATQLYLRQPTAEQVERIAAAALADARVDQVIWRTALTRSGASGYTVATARGRLEFWRGDRTSHSARDAFDTAWTWRGDIEAADLQQDGRRIAWAEYPNAFERLAGVLDLEKSGEIWMTAQPGCEFQVPGGSGHLGGASHGALHRLDSDSITIVAGGPLHLTLPSDLRVVDLFNLSLQVLGLPVTARSGLTAR